MSIISIIGAGYGDEGKGLAVDKMSSRLRATSEVTVVRVNGGAQAGHTVQTPQGARHVFHQFGAGSLSGARTHLSRDFVISPMFWWGEREALRGLDARVEVTIDPRTRVSTPWDVIINQAIEEARGTQRHGSCGMGFGESVERAERGFSVTMRDVLSGDLMDRFDVIRKDWFPRRMAEHGLDPDRYARIALHDGVMDRFLEDCRSVKDNVELVPDEELNDPRFGQIITEGAQGLGLDMDVGDFPHVTRSNTGLRNVVALANRMDTKDLDIIYMTRAYATRHGAGPFPGESDITGWAEVNDPTNIPNGWQGTLRFGALDLALMKSRIERDAELAVISDAMRVRRSVGVSCVDQVTGDVPLMMSSLVMMSRGPAQDISDVLGMELRLSSEGPHRDAVTVHDAEIVAQPQG